MKDDEIYVGKNDSFIPFCWSAPEVIKEKVFSKKSDVWSFGKFLNISFILINWKGATMWEVIQRETPF